MARKSAAELTQENIEFKGIHSVNQVLKNYGPYSFSKTHELFYGRESGIQYIYRPSEIDNIENLEFLSASYHVSDPKELFDVLKTADSVWIENQVLSTDQSTEFTLAKPTVELSEQNFTILTYTEGEIEPDHELDGSGDLYYQGTLVSNGFTTNEIVETISSNSKQNGHTLAFLQIDGDDINIVGSKTLIDQTKPFLLLDSHVLRKVKTLKNESSFFSLSFYNDYSTAIFGFGKENDFMYFCVNGIFKL